MKKIVENLWNHNCSFIVRNVSISIIFTGKIEKEIKSFANENLKGEINFKENNLSFFNHFPSLTLV
jgi:AsmA protein